MKIKKKVTRFLEDGNAIEVFVCVSIACVVLVVFYVLINLLFPKGGIINDRIFWSNFDDYWWHRFFW